ncbi:MAG TPA: hypothetical protein DF698_01665 [Candidatus Atribacteria bacterium]|nr:hypothetical protein [Candidatus Atribacteria bacterium]
MKVSAATAAYYTAKELGLTALLAGAGTSLTSCIGVDNEDGKTAIAGGVGTLVPPQEFEETVTPKVELPTSVPTSTEIPATPTPDSIPTLIPESYPVDSSRFKPLIESKYKDLNLTEALRAKSSDTQKMLTELGLDGVVDTIIGLFIKEETRRTGFSREEITQNLEWEYYLNEGKSWLVIPRDRESGHYLFPVITNGSCEGTKRKIDPSLATTLGKPSCEEDYFDLEILESAGGLGETRQVVFSDASGWFVFGEASISTKEGYAWYNMKKEREESWTAFKNFAPKNITSVSRVEIEKEGTGEKEITWTGTNGKPGVKWQFDPEIQDWKLDVLKLLAEAGIEYPEATSSHFEADYGEFNFRIPKDLSKQIGKPYIQIPQDLLEKMYLHAMGRYMLFERRKDPERYSEFFDIAEAIRQDELNGGERRWKDWPEFRTAAKNVLEDGLAPLEFKPTLSRETWGMRGEVKNIKGLDFNFVTKDKYQDILSLLESAGFPVFTSQHYMRNFDYDAEKLFFVNGQNITVFSYDRGWVDKPKITPSSSLSQHVGAPLEMLPVGMVSEWYLKGLGTLYKDCLHLTEINFLNIEDLTFFDPVNSKHWTEISYPRYFYEELMDHKFELLIFSPQN